jgi:hypothetical protein
MGAYRLSFRKKAQNQRKTQFFIKTFDVLNASLLSYQSIYENQLCIKLYFLSYLGLTRKS